MWLIPMLPLFELLCSTDSSLWMEFYGSVDKRGTAWISEKAALWYTVILDMESKVCLTQTLYCFKLLVILEYWVAKISLCESSGSRIAMGHQASRNVILNLLAIAKGRSQWAMMMWQMLKNVPLSGSYSLSTWVFYSFAIKLHYYLLNK